MKTIQESRSDIIEKLKRCWSIETSSRYTPENPFKGQCSVTSLVIQEHFGGEIMKTKVGNVWHFYNKIDDEYYDFTVEQFENKINYDHIVSTRIEAMEDTNDYQYNILSSRFAVEMKKI